MLGYPMERLRCCIRNQSPGCRRSGTRKSQRPAWQARRDLPLPARLVLPRGGRPGPGPASRERARDPPATRPHSPRSAAAGAPTSAGAPATEARADRELPSLGSARAAAAPRGRERARGLAGSEANADPGTTLGRRLRPALRSVPPVCEVGASRMPILRTNKLRLRERKTSSWLG